MKIVNISSSIFRVPTRIPLIEEPIGELPLLVCTVELEGGIRGRGVTSHFLLGAVANALAEDFTPLLLGANAANIEAIHLLLGRALNSRYATGVFSMALSALDIALWDAVGKSSGETVAHMLGGARDWAPVYCTFGFPQYDQDQLAEAAVLAVQQGHIRLKMVVAANGRSWQEDARRVYAVRDVIDDDIELMVDANQMYNPVEALQFATAISDCNITWFEEPLTANSIQHLRDLRARTAVPISAGQNEGSRQRLYDLAVGGAVDILQPHVCYCGGFTEASKVAHMAQCMDIPVANGGGWPHLNMHVMAGVANGWRVEYHLGHATVGNMMLESPLTLDSGRIYIPEVAGVGIRDDLGDLAKYRIGSA